MAMKMKMKTKIYYNTVGSCACLSVPGDLLCDVFNGT